MVLGLSLTSEDIVWVLVDETDGTVVDHDSAEFSADAEIAGAAARGAHAIATAGGFDVERIRLTWSDVVAREGLRLRSRLVSLGFDNVEAVPLKCAGAVLVDPDMEPTLALAYGAALAEVSLHDAITLPVSTRPRPRRSRRGRTALAALGAAAAAVVAGLLLTSGSLPQAEQTAAAAELPVAADPGWVAVTAPSESAARAVRKVVDVPDVDVPEQAPPVYIAPVVEAAPLIAPPVAPVPLAVPHLPVGTPHLQAPEALPTGQPHLVDAQPAVGPAPEMTDLPNLFTALP
jgi:hypothetical protein